MSDLAVVLQDLEVLVRVPFESQGAALDWVLEKYSKEDLLSIMWVEQDDDCHVFKVVLRSRNAGVR
jgi:trehalose-6-phosphatase